MMLLPPTYKGRGPDHHEEVKHYYMKERDGVLCLDSPCKSVGPLAISVSYLELAILPWDT